MVFPAIKEAVEAQLNTKSGFFSVKAMSAEEQKGNGAEGMKLGDEAIDSVFISDGDKYLLIPVMTMEMRNVSMLIDIIAFKQYLLSDE